MKLTVFILLIIDHVLKLFLVKSCIYFKIILIRIIPVRMFVLKLTLFLLEFIVTFYLNSGTKTN